jgi:hypothetical protein
MSQTDQLQMADSMQNKPRIITCFVHYNKTDDQSKIFDVLKDFRNRHGLKFSHHQGYIFFTLSSEHLDELSKVRPFKVSKFQTKSEFTCTKEVADKLIEQKDSFVRMFWNDETGRLTFVSRTLSRIHGQLVRRIFKDSNQQFDRDQYQIIRTPNDNDNDNEEQKEVLDESKVQIKPHTQESFVKVENKKKTQTKSDTPRTTKSKTKYEPKQTESDVPKLRGKRTTASTKK